MSSIRDPRAAAPAVALPLLHAADSDRVVLWRAHQPVRARQFLAEVDAVAARLPPRRQLLNLCEQRDRFLVAFCAGLQRGQGNLLPPSRAPQVLAELAAAWPDHHACDDEFVAYASGHAGAGPESAPRVDGDHVAAIGFTSGSTGHPRQHRKTWASFAASSARNAQAIVAALGTEGLRGDPAIVATVPPQHMYGMELSVLLPLLANAAVHGGRPFFPDDVARALREAQGPALLVTTPVHLRALVESGIDLPRPAGIVTATAPLPQALAAAAEQRFGCEVRELFGSTETCVIASRRTARDDLWQLLPDVRLQPQPDGTQVQAPHLSAPVMLADLVEMKPEGRFLLCGRQADLLEIAGKRASLGDLTRRLLAVPGVLDGVVLQLDPCEITGVRRIAALAVAPGLDEAGILDALRQSIDPLFLPRRLRVVDALPRNETGKLPRAALLPLLR